MVDMEELFRELCVRGRDYITVKDFKKYQYMQMLAEVCTSSCVRACVSSSTSSSNGGRGCLSESLGVRQCYLLGVTVRAPFSTLTLPFAAARDMGHGTHFHACTE